MSETMYAPPQADVDVVVAEEIELYVVGKTKFMLLAVLTMNLYLVYWFYRNWRAVKLRSGRNIWPPVRGFFYIFFIHSLFAEIRDDLDKQQSTQPFRPTLLATGFLVLFIAVVVIGQLVNFGIVPPLTNLVSPIFALVGPLFILPAQMAINVASGDPDGSDNRRLTLANWLWIALGLIVWAGNMIALSEIIAGPGDLRVE